MKFSILLPTRNRLDLLKLAIESVRRQDYEDWEIVVSDNASVDDISAFVLGLRDARLRARRSEQLIPVTDNWNASVDMARGDYVIMLGDDDALLPGALRALDALIALGREPDAIYAQALQYAYPGVVPGHRDAFLQTGYNAFLAGQSTPFSLDRKIALNMVRGAMSFRILYGFNMQHFVVSRRFIQRLRAKGPFFQSPYPDYYAANVVLLAAEQVIATPEPIALIGISPKSFGFYYFNEREGDGVDFLQNVADPDVVHSLRGELVPGSNMNDSWLCAMQTLARNFPDLVPARVGFTRYRRLQYMELLKEGRRDLVLRSMRWWEYPVYGAVAVLLAVLKLMPGQSVANFRGDLIRRWFTPVPRFDPRLQNVPYRDILEAASALGSGLQ